MNARVIRQASSGRTSAEFRAFGEETARELERELGAAVGGAVDFGAQVRALFATDAPNYRQVPIESSGRKVART